MTNAISIYSFNSPTHSIAYDGVNAWTVPYAGGWAKRRPAPVEVARQFAAIPSNKCNLPRSLMAVSLGIPEELLAA